MKKTVLSFLSSLKLTLSLFIIIAVASILGTVIPQQYEGGESLSHLSPGLAKAFNSLQLFDMYHSVWFIVLMGLLSLNLIVCSLNRFPASWRLFRRISSLDRGKPFENLSPDRVLSIEKERSEVVPGVERLFLKRYKRVNRKDTADTTVFYGQKGAYSHFGVYIIHASILIVIAGAIIGSLLGFEAFVNLPEGESTDTVHPRRQEGTKELGFTVRCDEFSIAYYDNGMPKEYKSTLSFLKNGDVIYQGPLLVNHPITVDGIRFYQASYGTIPGENVLLKISGSENDPENLILKVQKGHPVQLPGNEGRFQVIEVAENLRGIMGPAALISIRPNDGEETRFWVFQKLEILRERFPEAMFQSPMLNPSAFKPYTFFLDKIESKYYTGLQLSRDPGVSIVAIGSFFIIVGFFITFFSSHRRFWVRLEHQGGRSRISVAASSNRDPVGLEREIKYLLRHLKEDQEVA